MHLLSFVHGKDANLRNVHILPISESSSVGSAIVPLWRGPQVEELMSNPDRAARGTVIEAHLDKRRGPVATLLVQAGTLRLGDVVVASASYGKVRARQKAEEKGES